MYIYFAGSIRGGREDQALYHQIIECIKKFGSVLTEHVGDSSLTIHGETQRTSQEIYERDMAWVEQADVVIAEVTTPSLGVGYEIGSAQGKKPILCLFRTGTGRRLSAMIDGNRHVTVRTYNSVDDIEGILANFFGTLL